jgi:hypothetical protein
MSQLGANPYLLNIIPIFNVADPNNGADTAAIATAFSNLETMLDLTTYTVSCSNIQPYGSATSVTMTGNVDILGGLTVNGTTIGTNTSGLNFITGDTVYLSTSGASIELYSSTTNPSSIAINIGAGSAPSALQLDSLGRALYKGSGTSSNSNRLWVSTAIFHADRAAINRGGSSNMSTIFDVWNGDAYFDKSIYVNQTVFCQTLSEVSDVRFKQNITNIERAGALSTVCALQGIQYTIGGKPSAGFSAQQLSTILPYAVTHAPSGTLAVNYSCILPMVVEAIKELAARLPVASHAP